MRVAALVTLVDGEGSHPPGSTVEVEDGEAAVLVRRGFARPAPAEEAPLPAEEPAPAAEPAPAELDRVAAIVDAIALLEPGNPEHFTNAGKPEIAALAAILGWRPTAAERDEAFARSQG